jgi:cell division protease FtsH
MSTTQPKKPNRNNRKAMVNLFSLFAVIIIIVTLVAFSGESQDAKKKKSFGDLITQIENNNVKSIRIVEGSNKLKVDLYEGKNKDKTVEEEYPDISSGKLQNVIATINEALPENDKLEVGTGDNKVDVQLEEASAFAKIVGNQFFSLFINLLIFALIALFIIRRLGEVNSRSISFGNSRAKSYDELTGDQKVTFKDVAGNEEAKLELTEVVDFLKRPEEYIKMGARIPRGVLLVGAPGNGKTLMAKAIAGEADVPFFFVSGSEFVEMFVGVGAGRVRDLFKKAKKKEPCVIFIDEIDAVGRQRGAGLGGGNDEREQTLNQILVEMDGFEPNTSVIVIGATNRPDVLDPALLRPGRFDRQVTVTGPDKNERELILKVHSRNKKLAKDADLGIIARRTAGFSGADLMNVMNEAAILAVREGKKEIDNTVMREAIEKVVLGPSLKTKVITDEQKKLTAYHEAGHALVSTVIPEASDVQKITIIPRGKAGGYTFSDNGDNDPITRKKSEFMADISVLFGGYTVEKLIFGEVTTGASNDLAKATETARSMVTKYGMSDLGPISFDESKGLSFLGRDMVEGKHYSEQSAAVIDTEIQKILSTCFQRTQEIITRYRTELDALANKLIEVEVLELEEYNEITKMINPKLNGSMNSSN